MKKFFMLLVIGAGVWAGSADAYTLKSQKELGRDDARNQNMVVQCTTQDGKVSNQTCQLRRYVKCATNAAGKKNCNGWQPWQDLRSPGKKFSDWRKAAESCCQAKGLR